MSCGMDHKKMKMGKKCPECGHEKDEKDEMGKSAGLFGDKSLKAVDEHIKSIDDMWIMKGPQPGRAEWQKEHDQAVGAHKKSPSEATRHGLFRSAMRHPSNGGLTDHWAQVHGRANGGTTQASVTAAYNHPERRALRKKLGLPDGHEETMTKFMKKSAFDMGMMAKIAELRSYPIAKAKYHEDPDERAHVSRSIVATLGHLEGRGLLTPAGVKDLNHYRGAGSKDLESHSLFSGQIKPAGIDVAKNMMNDAYRAHRKVAFTVLDVAKGGAAIGGTIGAIRGARKAKAEGKSVAGGALKGGAGGALIGGVAVPTAVIGSAIVHSLLRDAAKAK